MEVNFKLSSLNIGLVVAGVLGLINFPALAFVALVATGIMNIFQV